MIVLFCVCDFFQGKILAKFNHLLFIRLLDDLERCSKTCTSLKKFNKRLPKTIYDLFLSMLIDLCKGYDLIESIIDAIGIYIKAVIKFFNELT